MDKQIRNFLIIILIGIIIMCLAIAFYMTFWNKMDVYTAKEMDALRDGTIDTSENYNVRGRIGWIKYVPAHGGTAFRFKKEEYFLENFGAEYWVKGKLDYSEFWYGDEVIYEYNSAEGFGEIHKPMHYNNKYITTGMFGAVITILGFVGLLFRITKISQDKFR